MTEQTGERARNIGYLYDLLYDIKTQEGLRNEIDYSGGPDGKEWIDCPRCGEQVVLRSW